LQLRNFAAVQNYQHFARVRRINQLESVVVFWNYRPAADIRQTHPVASMARCEQRQEARFVVLIAA
jgi:hypothetical protein